jgi:hypothetical protein
MENIITENIQKFARSIGVTLQLKAYLGVIISLRRQFRSNIKTYHYFHVSDRNSVLNSGLCRYNLCLFASGAESWKALNKLSKYRAKIRVSKAFENISAKQLNFSMRFGTYLSWRVMVWVGTNWLSISAWSLFCRERSCRRSKNACDKLLKLVSIPTYKQLCYTQYSWSLW